MKKKPVKKKTAKAAPKVTKPASVHAKREADLAGFIVHATQAADTIRQSQIAILNMVRTMLERIEHLQQNLFKCGAISTADMRELHNHIDRLPQLDENAKAFMVTRFNEQSALIAMALDKGFTIHLNK